MRKAYLSIFIQCLVALSSDAQYQPNPFRVISRSEGLPSPLIHKVYETSDGYFWVATQTGLARYDGRNFEMFYAHYADTNTITANIVTDLQEDVKGQLWIGSFTRGLSIYDLKTGKWKQIKTPTADANPVYPIMDIFRDKDNQIWIATGGRGLLKYNATDEQFVQYLPDRAGKSDGTDPNSNTIRRIINDPYEKHILWLAAMNGLYRFDKRNSQFELYENIKEGKKSWKDNSFHAICAPAGNIIWLGSWGGGLATFNKQTKTFENYPFQPAAYASNNLSLNIIYDLHAASDSILYIASYDAGLQEFNIPGKSFTALITNETGISREEVRPVQSICSTSNGCLWICGINAIYLKHKVYNRFGKWQSLHRNAQQDFKYPAYLNSVTWNKEMSAYLLACRSTGGILEYDSQFNYKNSIPVGGYEKAEADLWKIETDTKGSTWLQARGSPWLFRYEKETKSFRAQKGERKKINANHVSSFMIDYKDRIWIVNDSFLLQYHADSGIIRKYPLRPSEKSKMKMPIRYAYLDSDSAGTIWIGTNIGLWKFDSNNESWMHFFPDKSAGKNTLANADISCLAVDHTGKLWVAPSSQGIQVFDPISNMFIKNYHVSTDPSFRAPQVNYMQFDHEGRLWACTTNGLGLLQPASTQWEWFDKSDGLVKDYTDQPINITENNTGFLSQHNGFIAFNTSQLPRNFFIPRTRITGLTINGEKENRLSSWANSQIKLRNDQKQVSIHFTAIEPLHPQRLKYFYKLDGLDKEWQQSNQNVIVYGGLPAGAYMFRLKAQNSDGLWSEEAVLPLRMMAPFWQQWWFIGASLLFIAFVFYGLYRYRLYQIIQVQNLRNNISRNLHDELGSSVSSINMLSKVAQLKMDEKDPVASLLQQIGQSAQQAGESIDEIIWSVNPAHDAATPTFNRIRNHVSQLLERVGIDYEIELPELPASARMGMELRRDIWMICKEAINNLLKHAHCRKVLLKIEWKNEAINLNIEDDGVGFNRQQTMETERNGLRNIETRVKQYKGGWVKIDTSPGKGTRIHCQLPLKK